MADQTKTQAPLPFYKLGSRDLSSTSLESEALLDHRYVTDVYSISLWLISVFYIAINRR